MPSLNIRDYGLATLAIFIVVLLMKNESLEERISELEDNKSSLAQTVGSLKSQRVSLKASIVKQNLSIKVLEANHDKSIVELNEWKNKPIEVKYKTLYKYLPAKLVEVKTNDCNTTKDILDAISNINYNDI